MGIHEGKLFNYVVCAALNFDTILQTGFLFEHINWTRPFVNRLCTMHIVHTIRAKYLDFKLSKITFIGTQSHVNFILSKGTMLGSFEWS